MTVLIASVASSAMAATLYVWQNSPSPAPPYATWATAATNIQDAVDAAADGDEIVVTNGVYATGGRAVYGTMTNRVAITKSIQVKSVSGPEVTVIKGLSDVTSTNGFGNTAIRCAYVGANAVLSGFTLTNGHTRSGGDSLREQRGGGAWCESSGVITNCILAANFAMSHGGGAYGGTFLDCSLQNNVAYAGGGVAAGVLHRCTLTANRAASALGGLGGASWSSTLHACILTANSARKFGGGAHGGTLYTCTLVDNETDVWQSNEDEGGGAYGSTLHNSHLVGNSSGRGGGASRSTLDSCTLVENMAAYGGGTYYGTNSNCILTNNWGGANGGGAYGGTLYNCILIANAAGYNGGGSAYSTLYNCTVTGNTVDYDGNGGGLYRGGQVNCIVFYNTALNGANWHQASINYSCTTPLPDGTGNITNAPLFVDLANGDLRLQSNSPCINAGNNAYVSGDTDLDGNPRIVGGTVDMGAYEFQSPGSVIAYAWLQQFSLPTDGSVDFTDPDTDLLNTWQEWQADTNPTNALSVLRIESISPGPPLMVQFHSSSNRLYSLRCATNLTGAPWADVPGQTGVRGTGGVQTLRDTNAAPPRFYRVGVRLP